MSTYAQDPDEYHEGKPLAPPRKGDEYTATLEGDQVAIYNQRGDLVDLYGDTDIETLCLESFERSHSEVTK